MNSPNFKSFEILFPIESKVSLDSNSSEYEAKKWFPCFESS